MDLEQAVEFLLRQVAEQEARFAARLAKHDEWLERLERSVERLERSVERLEGIVERQQQQIGALTAFGQMQQEQFSQLLTVTRELANRQLNSEERLNALTRIVDDLIRHNGGSTPRA